MEKEFCLQQKIGHENTQRDTKENNGQYAVLFVFLRENSWLPNLPESNKSLPLLAGRRVDPCSSVAAFNCRRQFLFAN